MSGKDNDEISQRDREPYAKEPTVFKYVVSEGSIFVFDMGDFINEEDINNTNPFTFLSCDQTSGILVENLQQETNKIFSFKAPFLRHNDQVNTNLRFKLTFKDKNDSSDKKITHDAKVVVWSL